MDTRYDTAGLAAPDRSRHWEAAVGNTYFSLQLQFQDAARFEGSLRSWRLGALSLSRLASSPLCYRRLKTHLRDCNDEQYLVTVPRQSVYASPRPAAKRCAGPARSCWNTATAPMNSLMRRTTRCGC